MVQAVMMSSSAVMTNMSVTLASESEAPACLALIPKAASARVELLIARVDGEFAGAGAVFWANALEPPGFHALVRVLSGARRRGVGRKLIEASVALTDAETDGLWSFDAVPYDSGEAKFLEACGFKALRREYHYQVSNEVILADSSAIADRLRQRGRIPERAEIKYLSEPGAPLEEIAWLVSREFNSSPVSNFHDILRRRGDSADRSLYVRLDGVIVAAMLVRIQDGVAVVDARVVANRWRNNWPNAVMLEKALGRAKNEAWAHAKFFCDESVTDTINLARRGGEETDLKTRYYLAYS